MKNKSRFPARDMEIEPSSIPAGPSMEELMRKDAQLPPDRSTLQPLLKGDCLLDAMKGCNSDWKATKIANSPVTPSTVDRMFKRESR